MTNPPTEPGRDDLLAHEAEFDSLLRDFLQRAATAKLGVLSSRANDLLHKLDHLTSLRLSTRADQAVREATIEECQSIFVGVANVLDFAIGLAWDAERLIPDSEPKRLRNILNNIRQGYLKPAIERLRSLTTEPKRS